MKLYLKILFSGLTVYVGSTFLFSLLGSLYSGGFFIESTGASVYYSICLMVTLALSFYRLIFLDNDLKDKARFDGSAGVFKTSKNLIVSPLILLPLFLLTVNYLGSDYLWVYYTSIFLLAVGSFISYHRINRALILFDYGKSGWRFPENPVDSIFKALKMFPLEDINLNESYIERLSELIEAGELANITKILKEMYQDKKQKGLAKKLIFKLDIVFFDTAEEYISEGFTKEDEQIKSVKLLTYYSNISNKVSQSFTKKIVDSLLTQESFREYLNEIRSS